MDIFTLDADVVVTEEKDVLGGFQVLEQDIYPFVIKAAFMDKYKKGSHNITILLEDANGMKFTHQEYVADAEGKNYRFDKKTGKKVLITGMTIMNNLSILVDGKPLATTAKEEKVVKLYDREQKKEVPQKRTHFIDWSGKIVHVAMLKVIETKMDQDADGNYTVPTAETKTSNKIDKWFDANKLSSPERAAGITEPEFFQKWLDKNQGKERDKTVKGAPQAGTPVVAATAAPLTFS